MSQCDDCKYFSSYEENRTMTMFGCPNDPKMPDKLETMRFHRAVRNGEKHCELFVEKTDEEKKIRDEKKAKYEEYRKKPGYKPY